MSDRLNDHDPRGSFWCTLVLAALAAVLLWRMPYAASSFKIEPDSTEYAVGAAQLARHGNYELTIDGQKLPPRYPPWFAAFILAPALIFSEDLGVAAIPIFLLGVLAIAVAHRIGARIGGDLGGTLAALLVLAFPMFREWGRLLMTDIPSIAILLLSAWIIGAMWRAEKRAWWAYFGLGLLLAVNFLIRPVSGAAFATAGLMVLVREKGLRAIFVSGGLLAVPLAAAHFAGRIYNQATFGSADRSGYHFWSAVPYDYPELFFATSYVKKNLGFLADTRIFIYLFVAIAVFVAVRIVDRWRGKSTPSLTPEIAFFFVTLGPMLAFHLLYYSPRPRYFLPGMLYLFILIGGLLGRFVDRHARRAAVVALFFAAAFVGYTRFKMPPEEPVQRIGADSVREHTPAGSVIITRVPVPYMEYVANKDGSRKIIPLCRDDEYASTVIVEKRIPNPDPPPKAAKDYRCAGLLNGGAREAVDRVAVERVDEIAQWLKSGRPVYFETSLIGDLMLDVAVSPLRERFTFEKIAPELVRVVEKK